MNILGGDCQKQMTLSGMMDIVAARTLPFLPMSSGSCARALSPNVSITQGDPMDLSNIENDELNTVVDGRIQCHRCLGFGHIVRLCSTPIMDNRTAQFKPRGGCEGGGKGLRKQCQPSYQLTTTQQSPYRTGQPSYCTGANQPNWRVPPIHVHNVDDLEATSSAYFHGGWSEEEMSRTWRDRLLGAAAGAALTLTTLWLILVSAATATVILRA